MVLRVAAVVQADGDIPVFILIGRIALILAGDTSWCGEGILANPVDPDRALLQLLQGDNLWVISEYRLEALRVLAASHSRLHVPLHGLRFHPRK